MIFDRGSADSDGITGREIGHQGTDTSSYVYTIDWCVVVALYIGGVHDHNTSPMSTTSVASEHFRYYSGIAIISFIMPCQRKVSHKRCWQYNLLGERSRQSLLVECSYEILAVNSGIMMLLFFLVSS